MPPCRRERHSSRSRALVERLVVHQARQAVGRRLPLDLLEQPDVADRRPDQLAEQLDQRDVLAAERDAGRLVGQVQHPHHPLVADQRHDRAVGRLVVLGVGALGAPDHGLRVRVDVAGQDQTLALDRHHHRRRRILTQRHDLVDGKRMVVFDQMQNAVGLIERVERGKPRPDHQRNLRDTHVRDAVDVQAVDLPGQWSHLLQERDSGHTVRCVLIGSLAIVNHGPTRTSAPLTVVPYTMLMTGTLSSIPRGRIGKKRPGLTRHGSPHPACARIRLTQRTEQDKDLWALPGVIRHAAAFVTP